MKKTLLFLGLFAWSTYGFSQAVTAIDIAPYNWMEVGITDLLIDTNVIIASVIPTNASDKTVKFTIDSGDACTLVIDTTPAKLACTKEGSIKIKAAAQDGSGITATKTLTVKQVTKVDSYRLRFNANNLNILNDEHFQDLVTYPGQAPKIYTFSIDSNSLRIDGDKIGPETAPRSGEPALAWKGFTYGFSPVVLRLDPSMGISLDMSSYKNIRIRMRGANSKGHITTLTDGTVKAPNFRFFIAPCTKSVNCCGGTTATVTGDTVNYTRYLINLNGTTGNGLYDSSDVRFLWIKINDGATFGGWANLETHRSNDFKGSIWIDWIAFGKAADTVLVENITIAGEDSLLFVSKAQKFTYTATVLPIDATEKTYFWSTDDPTIATIDGSGKLSILKVGTVKVIATAQDGSGITGEKSVKCYYALGDKPAHSTDYAVYPNPADDVINIAGTSDLNKAELINVDGKVVKTAVSNKIDVLTINVSDLAGGVYILKCYADNGEVIVKKIVIE